MAAAIVESVPLKRFGTSAEVANVALFLASNEASHTHGADWVVERYARASEAERDTLLGDPSGEVGLLRFLER